VSADDHQLGFRGLLAAGRTPAEAWKIIHDDLTANTGAVLIIRDMEQTQDGRAALEWSRLEWAQHGLAPPWEDEP
jgi:hypothetical protein